MPSTHERFLLQSLERQRMVRFAGDALVGWSMSPLKRRPDTPSPEMWTSRDRPSETSTSRASAKNWRRGALDHPRSGALQQSGKALQQSGTALQQSGTRKFKRDEITRNVGIYLPHLERDNNNQQVRAKQPWPHCPPGAKPAWPRQKSVPRNFIIRRTCSVRT